MKRFGSAVLAMMLAGSALAQDSSEPVHPPPHTSPWPVLGTGPTEGMRTASLALGPEMEPAGAAAVAVGGWMEEYVALVAI